jgi:hypothetical protein
MEEMPFLPIAHDQIIALAGALIVYRSYRLLKTASTEERENTLLTLELLIPKLTHFALHSDQGERLLLTDIEIAVIKGGLTTLIDVLNRKPQQNKAIRGEIESLKVLRQAIETTFKTIQD